MCSLPVVPEATSLSLAGDASERLKDISITFPEDGTLYHIIEDKDFKSIMKIQSPKSFLAAMACLGYVAGELRTAIEIGQKFFVVESGGLMNLTDADFLYAMALVGTLVAGIIFGINAFRCESEVSKILKKIASRPPVKLNFSVGHEPQRSP